MPECDFSGRVALVTGPARGQGESHGLAYADHGADVVVLNVSANREGVTGRDEAVTWCRGYS
jgi:NAD(P)-dependent dehydrogenase (short-subunit alcohol dehydrogenase family)